MNPTLKHGFDLASFAIAAGALLDAMPKVAAVMSVIWLGMQIYDWIAKKARARKS